MDNKMPLRKGESPRAILPLIEPPELSGVIARFWDKVNKDGPIPSFRPDLGPCWTWTAADDGHGYGAFGVAQGLIVKAHRLSLELSGIEIPDDLYPDHLCRVRSCVNPSHLELKSFRANVLAGFSRSAEQARRDHCILGHPLSGNNLYQWKNHRHCKICRRARGIAWRSKRESTAAN